MIYSVMTSFKSHDLSSRLAYWGEYISNQINSNVFKSSNDKLSPNMAESVVEPIPHAWKASALTMAPWSLQPRRPRDSCRTDVEITGKIDTSESLEVGGD